MSSLALVHIAKKSLTLDDDTYRDLLERLTGKRSAAAMSRGELGVVMDEMRRLGFRDEKRQSRTRLQGPHAAKLQALWIAGWNLGVVRDRTDDALTHFIARQTGIEHSRWLRDPEDARKVIEALKKWLARETGVDWGRDGHAKYPHLNDPRYRIAVAQWQKLIAIGDVRPSIAGTDDLSALEAQYGYRVTGKGGFAFYVPLDWIALMNALGARLRGALARAAERAKESAAE